MLTKTGFMKKFFPFIIFVLSSLAANAQTASFTLATTPCHNDGVLNANFTGLTAPLTVSWQTYGTAGTIITHTGVTGLSDALTDYSGGPVFVSAMDIHGLSASNSFAGVPPITICSLAISPAFCPVPDTLSAAVCSGGTAPYTYQWYDVSTSSIVGSGDSIALPAGRTYGVTVTDRLGCTYGSLVDPSINLYASLSLPFADIITSTTASCTNGTANVTPFGGGTPPFTYLWSNGATTATISNLTTGTYKAVVTDATGCKDSLYTTVPQSITVNATLTATTATCVANNGTITAAATGGTAPYTYVWSNGATGATQAGLTAGFYSVNITDANGCTGTASSSVSSLSPIVFTYTTTPSLCITPSGTATLTVLGGTAPYNVYWYTYPARRGVTATSLTYGTYLFHVTDAAGCAQDGSLTIPPIDQISASYLATPASCSSSDGGLTVYPTGGVAPYSYSWSTGASSASISGKPAGTYAVTISDFAGCKVTENIYLPYNSTVGVGITSTPASCIFNTDGLDSAIVWGGRSPYSYSWSSGGSTPTISSLPTGPYSVAVTDAAGCVSHSDYSVVDYDHSNDDCYCIISGTVYHDINGNCLQDAGEPGIANVQIHIAGSTPDAGYTYTDNNGNYSYKVRSGAYIVTQGILPNYPLAACQTNGIPVTVSAASSCVHTVSFADSSDSVHDMHISTWDYSSHGAIPGQSYTQVTIISNDGTQTEDSVLASYTAGGYIFAPTFAPGGYFNGASGFYNTADSFTALAPGAAKQFLVSYDVPADLPTGTSIVFLDSVGYKGPVITPATDNTPFNNYNTFTTAVTNTSAPNFKEVSPVGTGAAGTISYTDSVLEYMVHFQNTNLYPAENVVIVDTLDNNLNWATLHPVFTSAPCQVSMQQVGGYKIVKFMFTDINLPSASTDQVRSNGMLTYTVHTNSGGSVGTTYKNRASVYLDDMAPSMTNTTLNTLGTAAPPSNVAVPVVTAQNAFTVYPNPANNTFNAIITSATTATGDLKVCDITGRTLITKTVNAQIGTQTVAVDVNHLAPGTYFVTYSANGATTTQKLVIIK